MAGIKPIGTILRPGPEDYLVGQASVEAIQPHWRPAIARCVTALRKHYGARLHSVYVRGSVAMGTAINGLSDLDLIVILDISAGEMDRLRESDGGWSGSLQASILKEFPFVEDVEITVRRREHLGEIMQRLIKLWSVCVAGRDLSPALPNYRVVDLGHLHRLSLEENLETAREQLHTAETPEAILRWCRWVMKRIIRQGFSLVAVRANVYTRDLYPCWEYFSRYYPEKKNEMRRALDLAVNPTADVTAIRAVMDELGGWVVSQSKELHE